jgi:hypothetical protein
METCETCIEVRDVLIDRLVAYSAFLQAERDYLRRGDSESAKNAKMSATRAGEAVMAAKAALDDHEASHS